MGHEPQGVRERANFVHPPVCRSPDLKDLEDTFYGTIKVG